MPHSRLNRFFYGCFLGVFSHFFIKAMNYLFYGEAFELQFRWFYVLLVVLAGLMVAFLIEPSKSRSAE